MKKGLSDLPGIRVVEPEGAFYIFADITGTGMSDTEFADGALEAGVQLIPASLITGGRASSGCLMQRMRSRYMKGSAD